MQKARCGNPDLGTYNSVQRPVNVDVPETVLDAAIAYMDCTIDEVYDAGDHHFVMGRVVELEHADPATEPRPLLFYKGGLGRFQAH